MRPKFCKNVLENYLRKYFLDQNPVQIWAAAPNVHTR